MLTFSATYSIIVVCLTFVFTMIVKYPIKSSITLPMILYSPETLCSCHCQTTQSNFYFVFKLQVLNHAVPVCTWKINVVDACTYYTIYACTTLYYLCLYYTILSMPVLYYTILSMPVLRYIIYACTILYYLCLYCTILYYLCLHYAILSMPVLYYIIYACTILYYLCLYYTILSMPVPIYCIQACRQDMQKSAPGATNLACSGTHCLHFVEIKFEALQLLL